MASVLCRMYKLEVLLTYRSRRAREAILGSGKAKNLASKHSKSLSFDDLGATNELREGQGCRQIMRAAFLHVPVTDPRIRSRARVARETARLLYPVTPHSPVHRRSVYLTTSAALPPSISRAAGRTYCPTHYEKHKECSCSRSGQIRRREISLVKRSLDVHTQREERLFVGRGKFSFWRRPLKAMFCGELKRRVGSLGQLGAGNWSLVRKGAQILQILLWDALISCSQSQACLTEAKMCSRERDVTPRSSSPAWRAATFTNLIKHRTAFCYPLNTPCKLQTCDFDYD